VLQKASVTLKERLAARIKESRESAAQEVRARLAQLQGANCAKIYHGPLTDANTADNPYVSWDELEMRRTVALAKVNERVKQLEPKAEYTNRVYHELIRKYRPVLSDCYHRIKKANPSISDSLGLRVRLKRNGEVKTLAIEWMDHQDERLLDCVLEKAGKWRLPEPDAKTDFVVVPLDFQKL
jgi:hypothetical protein